jgi:hypothetical protein
VHGSWKDAVSATRRFESSRPSQPMRSRRLGFRVCEKLRSSLHFSKRNRLGPVPPIGRLFLKDQPRGVSESSA